LFQRGVGRAFRGSNIFEEFYWERNHGLGSRVLVAVGGEEAGEGKVEVVGAIGVPGAGISSQ
jgi:hypothetical protein